MSSFITQIRRDLADHRGTVFWTPMIIAGIMAALIIVAAIVGKLDLGGFTKDIYIDNAPATDIMGIPNLTTNVQDGKLLFDNGTGPKPFHTYLDAEKRNQIEQTYALTTGLLAIPLALLALITLPFAMSSTLYEERKDRSILFWKSMPVTDLTAVGSRMLSLPLGTIFWALVGAVGLHALLFCIGLPIVLGNGFLSGISLNMIGAVLQTWAVVALMAVIYVLWAAPVLAWFLLVSSAAPKAPFIIAVAPFVLIPLFGTVLDVDSSFMMDPLYRLIGAYVIQPMEGVAELWENDMPHQIGALLPAVATSLADWQLWAGLAVAAGLVFAASEVRRRRTL
jgi:ABC-2 type transport system permease protein